MGEPMKIALKPAMPVKQAARQRLAALAAAEKHADGKTNEVEVDGPTLAKSLAEAKSLGFKGHPRALVYHPAHGKPVVYNLEDRQAAAATMLAAAPTQAEKRDVCGLLGPADNTRPAPVPCRGRAERQRAGR